jgi:GTPase
MTNIKKIESITENNKITYSIDNDTILRTGDKATVELEFIIRPEYIKPNMKIIFREGKVRAIGKVVELL